MVKNNFSSELFFSEDRFLRFFKGVETVQEISSSSKTQNFSSSKLFYNRWQVAWIVIKTPLYCLFSLFLKCISHLAKCLGLRSLSIRCEILAKHCARELEVLKTQCRFKERFLASALNAHRKDSSELYLHSPLSLEAIKSRLIFETTFYEEDLKVHFYHEKGMCRGALLWFFYLLLNTQGLFPDLSVQLKTVCKQFEKGVPKEAALLHSLCYTEKSLLGLDVSPVNSLDLALLAPGVYRLSLPTHCLGYITTEKEGGFLFDPNHGLFSCSVEEVACHLEGRRLTRIDKVAKAVSKQPERKNLLAFNQMK